MKKFQNTLGECLSAFWTNYVGWGRATRSEYWWAVLFYCFLVQWLLFIPITGALAMTSPEAAGFAGLITNIYSLAATIPGFCLAARRLHDTNRSAWNMLLGLIPIVGAIILIVYMCQKGDAKANRFGEPRI